MTYGLTRAQRLALDFIASAIADKGHPPSYREIADGLGFKSMSQVVHILARLRDRGHIDWIRYKPRSLRLVAPGPLQAAQLPPALRRRLEAHCGRTGDCPEDVIVDAIELHLDAHLELVA
jgi:repressor LexA